MPWNVCGCCNTSHLKLDEHFTLWNVGGDYMIKDNRTPEIDFTLGRILRLVMVC